MQPGTLVAGKYRVERVIGRGGMGLVVEATHLHLGHRVALKFLAEDMASDQTALARFRREAQAAAQLKSEHVCRVSDVGVEGKAPYIVMDLLVGTDLARLSKVRVLDYATAALYIKQACLGLAEAHAAKIIHRDLKPGNLFLTRRADGSPLIKVLDFGVAKAPDDASVKLTGTSNVVGSPGFMSPEQFRSSKSVDARTDVWSLGVILYKLVSGRLPFKADGFAEFALAITRDALPPLPEVPPAFEAVVARCLEKDPAKRFPDVLQLAEALAPFAANARASAPQIAVDEPSDEVSSGIGGSPDTGERTRLLGSHSQSPPLGSPVAAPPPAAASPAPRAAASPPPAAAKQTILGVLGREPPATTGAQPVQQRPTAAETAVPQQTVAGTAVGHGKPRYMPTGDLAPGTAVGEYRIDQKIGEGGMGVVYSATHPMIGKRAAIKVIASDLGTEPVLVQRFIQEARSVNQIGHPNIVDIFAFGKLPDGRDYFVMEFLQGESLRARLYRAFMSITESVQILDEIASALEAAHEKQVVHRDLKPDNVFLASVRGGYIRVKLLDFGIAKLAGESGIAKTSTGEMMGTPAYLSPEQARGRNVDYRTDIYALGCMMYEMITGRLPFIAESPMDVVLMHVSAAPRKPSELKPEIPPLLEQTILQMLDKDPARRPSLVHVRNVFAELVASGLVQLEPGSSSMFRSDLSRRRGESEIRTPQSVGNPLTPAPPIVAEPPSISGGRRRNASPSDAPTGIAFTPGPATLTPSDKAPTTVQPAAAPKSRARWFAIAFVALVLLVPTGIVVYGRATKQAGGAAPADAAALAVRPALAGDASLASATIDAGTPADAAVAATPMRAIELRLTPAAATLQIDGKPVDIKDGVARVELADGAHLVVATASGYVPLEKTIEVSAAAAPFSLKLDRARRRDAQRTTQANATTTSTTPPPTTTTQTTTTTTTGQGSATGSARKKDETIDPFAP